MSKPSEGQIKVLNRAGYAEAEYMKLSVREASALIDKVKANNWQRLSPSTSPSPEEEVNGNHSYSEPAEEDLSEYTR